MRVLGTRFMCTVERYIDDCFIASVLLTGNQSNPPGYQEEDCRLHRTRHNSYLPHFEQHSTSVQKLSVKAGCGS